MVSTLKTAALTALIATYLVANSVGLVRAEQNTPKVNSYNNNNPVNPYYTTKEEDISDKVKDKFMVNNLLCSRIELTNYYSVEDEEKEFLYKLCIFKCDKKPIFPDVVNNAIKNDKLKEIVSAFYYNKENIIFLNYSIKKLEDGIYFALLLTNKKKPEKKFEIEMPVENEKN